jgi:hypothetical protein
MIRSKTGTMGRGNPRVPPPQGFYEADQIIYVGKHGADTNSGESMAKAKFTVADAIATAVAGSPSSVNPYVIYAEDAGIYEEDITLPEWVSLWMPNATLDGQGGAAAVITVNSNVKVKLHEVVTAAGQWGVLKTNVVGTAWVDINRMEVGAGGIGALNLASGVLFYSCRTTLVGAGGFGVGDLSTTQGHMHLDCGDIYLQGVGAYGVAHLGAGSIVGSVQHILESGAGIGFCTGIVPLSGEIVLDDVAQLNAAVAYNVAAGATLRMDVGERGLTGLEINSGTVRITSRADDSAWHNPKGVAGNQTNIGTGAGTQLLSLDGATASLVGTRICPAGRRATLGVRVRIQDDDDTDQWSDEWSIGVTAVDTGNVRLTDGGGANSGAPAGVATLSLIGRDSTYSYTMVMTAATGTNLITLAVAEAAAQAREAQVEMWWDEARVWS